MAHILIVDDQPYLKHLLSEDLSDEGHRITHVEDPEVLMDNLQSDRPDMVLLDLYFNGFEGWNLLSDIKRTAPHLPVVIVSAYDTFMDDPRVARADGYVVKDIYTDKIKEKIHEILIHNKH